MKILIISLGCDKNLVDTEMMLGELSKAGYEFTDDENEADFVVVNTCSFIRDAKKESIDTLLEMGAKRISGEIKGLIAAGCLAERYSDEIREQIPEVDAIIGTMAIDEIVSAITGIQNGERPTYKKAIDGSLVYGLPRVVTTGGHYAYLKIAEGCDKHCTYCAIPGFRGTYRSVPMEVLLKEAETLSQNGVKELILVAQETTLYGMDLYKEKSLPKLLRELSKIPSLYFIRILYCYPEEIDDELIQEIRDNPKVLHYLDMPIQHASDRVLKRMGRRTNHDDLVNITSKLRSQIPDICIRTTLISGFPGETWKDFLILRRFIREIRFERLGVFAYSKEEGTGAARMKHQIPGVIKTIRRNALMRIQQKIAFEAAAAEVGKNMTVMVEGRLPEDDVYVTRTYKDAPNVDGFLFMKTAKELMTGDVIEVVVTGANKYDLVGVPKDEFTE